MPFRSRRFRPNPEPLWRRLDRAAREVNPFLLIFAIGLVVLYLTCVIGLLINLPITKMRHSALAQPAQSAPAASVDLITLFSGIELQRRRTHA